MPNEEMNLPVEGQQPTGPLTPGGEDTPKKPKDAPKDDEAANELLNDMFYSPSAGDADATLSIDKTADNDIRDIKEKPEAEELLEILEKGEGKVSEKYKKELLEKAMKDPTSIQVKTPRGWMSVKDAIGDGFDLTTNDFTNEPIPKVDWNGEIAKLDPREQQAIRNLTKPGTRQAGPAPEGGDVVPGETGEPIPPVAQGQPVNNTGAMGPAAMEGTELPLGGE
jgi:hypothetical protein